MPVERIEVRVLIIFPLPYLGAFPSLGRHRNKRMRFVRDARPLGYLELEKVVRRDQTLRLGPLLHGDSNLVPLLPQAGRPIWWYSDDLDERRPVLGQPKGLAAIKSLNVLKDNRL